MYIPNISPAAKNMMKLLAASIGTGDAHVVDFTIWKETYCELRAQAVSGHAANLIEAIGLPVEVENDCISDYMQSVQSFNKILIAQDDALRILHYADIQVIVLKGTAAARYYPIPEARKMGDIDLMVLPGDFENARKVLQEAGYSEVADNDYIYHRHTKFMSTDGVEIELHRKFSDDLTEENARYIDDLIYDSIPNADHVNLYGYDFPVLPDAVNGIVLITHIRQHIQSGLGLRQIIDWKMFIDAWLTDERWPEFAEMVRKIGSERLAITVTQMCKKYFGLSNNITWCNSVEEKTADRLLEYILDNGNFGGKIEKKERYTETVMLSLLNPVTAIRYLNAGGMCNWKAAREHAWLRPFAWLYQIGHLLHKGIGRKIGIAIWFKELSKSRRDVMLMKRLGIM